MNVTGRLAPTPSGLLHIGNARSFLLAWLWARSEGGKVTMRVEDIDLPRCRPEYREQALSGIAWLGLDWDEGPHTGDVVGEFDQHTRTDIYRKHLQTLIDKGLAYPCTCSRKDIREASSAPHGEEGAVYPGTCRDKYKNAEQALKDSGQEPAWRFRFEGEWSYADKVSGSASIDASTLGDFVLWRRDDLPSYQLAVTVDDAQMGVTQVLRGRDLKISTFRQLALYQALGLNPPSDWAHVPFLQDETGRRMAKRDGDLSIRSLRETGIDASRLVGLLAWSAGLQDDLKPVAVNDLIRDFKVSAISKQDFAFKQEHLDWLRSASKP